MRILWHSAAPTAPTGYGQQTALWLPRLASLGHDVTASGALSYSGAPFSWEGITVLPGWQDLTTGQDILHEHYQQSQADLLITLCDAFVFQLEVLSKMRAACWVPVDTTPCDYRQAAILGQSGAVPVAMSRHGFQQLTEAGLAPLYVPHGVDTSVFTPQDEAERARLREDAGIPAEAFVVGICAANRDAIRKGFAEQFRAFAALHQQHPGALLMVHSCVSDKTALDLAALAKAVGVEDSVLFPDQYAYVTAQIAPAQMASWYSLLDVLSNCTYGEGFGLPVIEAQACGVPVIVTGVSSMPELCGSGWMVDYDPFWVPLHRAWWGRPNVAGIHNAYEQAWQAREDGVMPALRDKARSFAMGYDVDHVLAEYWAPAIDALAAR